MTWFDRAAYYEEHGLYERADEHDACGVGMIVSIDGSPRRDVVEKAIEGLQSIYHRGAVDADGKTGDGAGVMMQIPQIFFHDYLEHIGQTEKGTIAIGMVFLPKKDLSAQDRCRGLVETEIIRYGYEIYGWRGVPVEEGKDHTSALASLPEVPVEGEHHRLA